MILRSRMLLLASALPFVAGCGVYLHDAQLESSTSALKASYEAFQAPAMLAELKAGETQFAGDEDRAIVDYGVTARNAALLGFINTPSQARRTGMSEFIDHVRGELRSIYGSSPLTPEILLQLTRAPDIVVDASRERAHLAAEVQQSTRGFTEARDAARRVRESEAGAPEARLADPRPTDCTRVPPAPPLSNPLPSNIVELRYLAHQRNCDALRRADLVLASRGIDALRPPPRSTPPRTPSTPSRAIDPCSPNQPDSGATGGGELARLETELRQASRRRACANAEVQSLSDAIRSLQDNAPPGGSLVKLNKAIADIQQLLQEAQPRAQLVGLEQLSTFIEELLAVELTEGGEAATPSQTTVRAAAALQALRALAQARDEFAASPRAQRTNALLLGAARIRHDIRMAQLDVAQEDAEIQVFEAQVAALLAKASHYARIQLIIDGSRLDAAADFTEARRDPRLRAAAGEALAAYVGAWNQGEIPYRLLQFKGIQARRSTAIERATLTEADYRTSLKPVFDQLAAYGAGGIRPEAIAQLLGQLGIASAIFRE